jgi:hypothetical protein
MNRRIAVGVLLLGIVAGWCRLATTAEPAKPAAMVVDYRYAPTWWQTSICLPDDWQKTLVGKEGTLLYDFGGKFSGYMTGKAPGFKTQIGLGLSEPTEWVRQELVSARVPIVRTIKRCGAIEIEEEAYAAVPGGPVPPFKTDLKADKPTRIDVLVVHYRNTGKATVQIAPVVTVESTYDIACDTKEVDKVRIGEDLNLWILPGHYKDQSQSPNKRVFRLDETALKPGEESDEAICVSRGSLTELPPEAVQCDGMIRSYRDKAMNYWTDLDLPYGHIEVPDAGIQATLDSSIRNIYQAREIKKGLPAFQVGPTCYRGLWTVDGSFLLDAVAMLGRPTEARAGIEYLLSFQRKDGAMMLIPGHWKETGIVLWAVTRHARLTGDRKWLEEVWPKLQRAMEFVKVMRTKASVDPKAPNYGLIPGGFSDGGLAGSFPEYTNIYWTLAGVRAAVDAARWLGHTAEAEAWQREYDDFYAMFRLAAERDTKTDEHGNRYVPIRMSQEGNAAKSPPKAQWAFLHAVFPGKVFPAGDPLVKGNMAVLEGAECQGLIRDTGWTPHGIWTYCGSFYAHAWLWNDDGQKAAQTLYDFANHASPLLVWREEQMPVGEGDRICGDMPHNWASAEFIRLVRHLIALERGDELHLLEGVPPAWIVPGKSVRFKDVLTEFGPISLELRTAADGREAVLTLDPPRRDPPKRIVLHLAGWSGRDGTMELPVDAKSERRIEIKQP